MGAPGGSFLGVWGDEAGRRAFLAGGFVGLDPARAPRGVAGRLVEYRAPGRFVTRCMVDAALWWASGVATTSGQVEVWAAGDQGRVLRYREGRCEELPVVPASTAERPTFWGVLARAPNDVWLVGGSPRPDGPRGVLLHGDGLTWSQATLPPRAAAENLYKIAADGPALVVVGSGGLVLRLDSPGAEWREISPSAGPRARLFTVHCALGACAAVGGAGNGVWLTSRGGPWRSVRTPEEDEGDPLPGLNGVWVRGADDAYAVGVDGLVMHLAADGLLRARAPVTTATLHGVGGFGRVVLAVGGELGNATPMQRGVILLRDDDAGEVTLDGVSYSSAGLQRSRAGAGQ